MRTELRVLALLIGVALTTSACSPASTAYKKKEPTAVDQETVAALCDAARQHDNVLAEQQRKFTAVADRTATDASVAHYIEEAHAQAQWYRTVAEHTPENQKALALATSSRFDEVVSDVLDALRQEDAGSPELEPLSTLRASEVDAFVDSMCGAVSTKDASEVVEVAQHNDPTQICTVSEQAAKSMDSVIEAYGNPTMQKQPREYLEMAVEANAYNSAWYSAVASLVPEDLARAAQSLSETSGMTQQMIVTYLTAGNRSTMPRTTIPQLCPKCTATSRIPATIPSTGRD